MSDTTDGNTDSGSGPRQEQTPFGLDLGPEPAVDLGFSLDGHVERYDDAPDECTIFPRTATAEFPRTTTWLTAQEGSYCSLDEHR